MAPALSAMLSISREVEVKPLGPVQAHDPPLLGCGPRSTAVEVEATVAELTPAALQTPATEIYGTIAVGVQEAAVTASVIVVVALSEPEVPVTVTVEAPVVAVLLAVSVSTLEVVEDVGLKAAVTPLGIPDAVNATLPLKGLTSVTVMVSVPLELWATDRVEAEGLSEKLPVDEVTVMVNACVLLLPQLLV